MSVHKQRVPVGNTMRYVDMVFYNKLFRAYVLIELKAKSLCRRLPDN